jgi:Bacterial extracellular solute-binding protein
VDVVYTIGPYAYTAGVQGLAVELDPSIVTNLAMLTAAGKPEGGNFYTNIYTYTIPVIFNTAKTSFATGDSIGTLADPKYKKILFVAPNFSPLLYPYAKMMNIDLTADLTPVWNEIAKLRPNIAAVGDDTVLIDTFKSGETSIGIGGLIGDIAALKADGVKADYAVASEGSTLTADSMFVAKGLPDDVTYYAQVFVNKVIDAKLQTEWCAKVQTVPVNSGAQPASSMVGEPGFPFTDEELAKYAIIEPFALSAENNDAWQAAYTNAIQATGGA